MCHLKHQTLLPFDTLFPAVIMPHSPKHPVVLLIMFWCKYIIIIIQIGAATIKSPKIIYPQSCIFLVEVQGIHVDMMDPKYF
jgi:hypothetical protein